MKKIVVLFLFILMMTGISSAQTDLLQTFSDVNCYKVVQCKLDSTNNGKHVKNILFSFPDTSLFAEAYLESKIFKKKGDKMRVAYLSIDCKDSNHLSFNAQDLKTMSEELVRQLNAILQKQNITVTY
ncbi:MAG: hypothetical protein WC875_04755 [Candidatus Absconditabacterales bacterium]|jgi:hypothetical protein